MDFLQLATTARRHWIIMALGVIVATITTFAVLFEPSPSSTKNGDLRFRPRSYTTYQAHMQVIILDPEFGIGRAGGDLESPNLYGTTVNLAPTYADLLASEAVTDRVRRQYRGERWLLTTASRLNSPIIDVSLEGKDPEGMSEYAMALVDSLQSYLERQQSAHGVPERFRVSVSPLATPVVGVQSSRQWEMALLAFGLPMGVAYALALVRERAVASRVEVANVSAKDE